MTAKDFGQLLRNYPQMLDNGQIFANILKDFYPDEKANVQLMRITFMAGVVSMVQQSPLNDFLTNRIINILTDEYSIIEEKARWAAKLWTDSYYFFENGTLPVSATDSRYFKIEKSNAGYCIKKYIGDDTQVIIPAQIDGIPITEIYDQAFVNCKKLCSITIPDTVTHIGDSAFMNCIGLTNMTIPDTVTYIGDSAFMNCIGLTNMTIPDGVTYIGDSAFMNCIGLTNMTIPDGVTHISDNAFMKQAAVLTADNKAAAQSGEKKIMIAKGVQLKQKSVTKEQAIQAAGELMVKLGYVGPEYVDAMQEREKLVTTYMGMGIAIPHGTTQAKGTVKKTGIVLFQYPDGVAFGDEKAYLVFGIAGIGDEHLDLLAKICDTLDDEDTLEKMKTTGDVNWILNQLTW